MIGSVLMQSSKIKSIKYIGKQDVYNMEVKEHHNFSVSGGLIVHNSIDALRYSVEEINGGNKKIKLLSRNILGL